MSAGNKQSFEAVIAALVAEVAEVRRMVAQLLQANDRSIKGFCQRQSISRADFYTLKKTGQGPRVSCAGRRKIITPDAEADWQRSLATADAPKPNGGEATP